MTSDNKINNKHKHTNIQHHEFTVKTVTQQKKMNGRAKQPHTPGKGMVRNVSKMVGELCEDHLRQA